MPVQGRDPGAFADHDRIYAVSGWVRDGLKAAGLPAWDEPLYGVADTGSAQPRFRRTRKSAAPAATTGTGARAATACSALCEPLVEMTAPASGLRATARPDAGHRFAAHSDQAVPLAVRASGAGAGAASAGESGNLRQRRLRLGARPRPRARHTAPGQVRFWGQQRDVGVDLPDNSITCSPACPKRRPWGSTSSRRRPAAHRSLLSMRRPSPRPCWMAPPAFSTRSAHRCGRRIRTFAR
jgi:hypothetical protein